MSEPRVPPATFAVLAASFEGAIAVIAVGLGWWLDLPPLATLSFDAWGWLWGAVATLPMLGVIWLMAHSTSGPLKRLMELVDEHLTPLFAELDVVAFAAIAFLAGLGEEMLFRGIFQAGVENAIGGTGGAATALVLSGIGFGLLHALSREYLVLATLIGLYLGAAWMLTGNLLVPVFAHAAYDFLALVYLTRIRPRPRREDPSDKAEA